MSEPVAALGGARADGRLIGIEDTGLRGQILLRGDLDDAELARAVRDIAGADLPETWQAHLDGERGVVWMSTDEVLLLMPRAETDAALARAGDALRDTHHLALDVSDARVVLRLTGALVGEVLAKGVPCDVSDSAFPPGSARRTHLGGIAVAFWRLDAETWEIVAFRSFAHHLMAWLEQSAAPGSEVGFA